MITVTRVEDANGGSYVDPPLDQAWDEPTKLEWQAAVVSHDTGLNIVIHPGEAAGRYCVDIRSPISGGTLSSAAIIRLPRRMDVPQRHQRRPLRSNGGPMIDIDKPSAITEPTTRPA